MNERFVAGTQTQTQTFLVWPCFTELSDAGACRYPVTIYLQSGSFFNSSNPSSAADFLPDDEQVIFQDAGPSNQTTVPNKRTSFSARLSRSVLLSTPHANHGGHSIAAVRALSSSL